MRLPEEEYSRDSALELLAAARGSKSESWAERSRAALLLEKQMLRLAPQRLEEFDVLLVALGLKAELGEAAPVQAFLLGEGFTSLRLSSFVEELLRKLRRSEGIERAPHEVAKLALARYVFTPEEVVRQIRGEVRATRGWTASVDPSPLDAPAFEREILHRLCAESTIYWVSERCGSELNALVEYPLTSAVLVVKPPGSDYEIEIKRAGIRGARALDVIRTRNGRPAPTSHRLFGGSLGWLAKRETAAGEIFAKIYGLVHGGETPSSVGVRNASVVTVPVAEGEVHILDYLTEGIEETQDAMKACVAAFPGDTGVAPASYEGDAGLTLKFIGQALPEQAIIFGSSSFRLDRIAVYLSASGPEEYFRAGLRREYDEADARWLADTVLEEILGCLKAPALPYVNYARYVEDAFATPENRRRADETYVSVMEQIGTCWGTLLAVRGFSDGESFVLRNAGLKSGWRRGEWRVRFIFMDHDDLTVAGSRYPHLWPWRETSGMASDLVHILGGPMGEDTIPGEAGALRSIYRVNEETAGAGLRALQEGARAAYRKTQSKLDSDEELRSLFRPEFLRGFRDFDDLVPWFFEAEKDGSEAWKVQAEEYLRSKGYGSELADEYTRAVVRFRTLFERLRFLYVK